MNTREEHLQRFSQLVPWNTQHIIRCSWSLHYEDGIKRDLELWLRKRDNLFDPLRLKLHIYDVSARSYRTIYLGMLCKLQVEFSKKDMQYVFLDVHDSSSLLFECRDFDFRLDPVGDDDW